jgi:magnesium-transporting ATPase (P-type)
MHVVAVWTTAGEVDLESPGIRGLDRTEAVLRPLAVALARCTSATLPTDDSTPAVGDPTETAPLLAARRLGADITVQTREQSRRGVFRFDPTVKLMSTIDNIDGSLWLNTKGAPESVIARCTAILQPDGTEQALTDAGRSTIEAQLTRRARKGFACSPSHAEPSKDRCPHRARRRRWGLCLVGLVSMLDAPRPEVAHAVARCHRAGIRILVVTGDHGLTARAVARRVGVDADVMVTGPELEAMSDAELDRVLSEHREIIFARNSPEAKLRIADALRDLGEVVAMTGDGVNDAPALKRADIGIAMGQSGTDVARDAATMILTDDNFANIAVAVAEGRRVYENVRKFIFYIFVHATPEVVPFLLYALSGGRIPLPLTVLQILAIDLGTETLPALALEREPAEPGLMDRPPRPPGEGVIQPAMLLCAWVFLGLLSAGLVVGGYFFVLVRAGWHLGAGRRPNRVASRLPGGHDDDLSRHRRLPDRYGVRGPDRTRISARGRCHDQSAPAVGNRVRGRVCRGRRRRSRLAHGVRHERTAPRRAAPARRVSRDRVGSRRDPARPHPQPRTSSPGEGISAPPCHPHERGSPTRQLRLLRTPRSDHARSSNDTTGQRSRLGLPSDTGLIGKTGHEGLPVPMGACRRR